MRYSAVEKLKVLPRKINIAKQLVIFTSQCFASLKFDFDKYSKPLPLPPLIIRN